jgi:hypothetical protein
MNFIHVYGSQIQSTGSISLSYIQRLFNIYIYHDTVKVDDAIDVY